MRSAGMGRERKDGKRVAEFNKRYYAAADEPSAGAVFARSAAVLSKFNGGANEHLQLAPGFWAIVDFAAADAGTPVACGGDFESEPRTKLGEVRGRRDVDLGLQLFSVAVWGRVFVRQH